MESKEQISSFGVVRLLGPDRKTTYFAKVIILQVAATKFLLCPLWKNAVNKLVPIMRTDDQPPVFYIDSTDPFAYELWDAPTLDQRIKDFNLVHGVRENGITKIVKIASLVDLQRAGIPCGEEGTDLSNLPLIQMFI